MRENIIHELNPLIADIFIIIKDVYQPLLNHYY